MNLLTKNDHYSFVAQKDHSKASSPNSSRDQNIKTVSPNTNQLPSLWLNADEKEKKLSVETLNQIFHKSNTNYTVHWAGSTNHKSNKEKVEMVVSTIEKLAGGSIARGIQILLSSERFRDYITDVVAKEMKEKNCQAKLDKEKLSQKLLKIEEVFNENLDLIYKSFDTPTKQINEIRKFLKALIVKATGDTILAKRICFKSESTYYRNTNNGKLSNEPFFQDSSDMVKWAKQNSFKPLSSVTLIPSVGFLENHQSKHKIFKLNLEEFSELALIIKEQPKPETVKQTFTSQIRILNVGKPPFASQFISPKSLDTVSKVKDCTHIVVNNMNSKALNNKFFNTQKIFWRPNFYSYFLKFKELPPLTDKFVYRFPTNEKETNNFVLENNDLTPNEIEGCKSEKIVFAYVNPKNIALKRFSLLKEFLKESAGVNGEYVVVYVDFYGDGCTSLNWPLSLDEITYYISSEYLKNSKDITFKSVPFLLIKARELKENNYDNLFLRGVILGQLFASDPVIIEGRAFIFRPRYSKGDNKWVQMMMSNIAGGKKRCFICPADFSSTEIRKLFNFSHFSNLGKKSFLHNFEFFRESPLPKKDILKTAKNIGLDCSPVFVEGMYSVFQQNGKSLEEFKQVISSLEPGLDPMHCIGWFDRLFKKLENNRRIDRVILQNTLTKLVKKRTLSECNFEKKRKVLLNFEQILKSLKYNFDSQKSIKKDLTEALSNYRIIVWITYSKKISQKLPGMRLLLHYCCFVFSLQTKRLPSELKLMNLFLHLYFSHFPDQFEKESFQTTNSEDGEYDLHCLKKLFRNSSRNCEQTFNLFFEKISKKEERKLLLCKDDKERLQVLTKNEKPTKEDEFSSFRSVMMTYTNPKLEIPLHPGSGSPEEISIHLFLEKMKNKYPDLLEKKDGFYIFLVQNDIRAYLEQTKPIPKKIKKKK